MYSTLTQSTVFYEPFIVEWFIKTGLLEFLKTNFVGQVCRFLVSFVYFELFLYIPGLTTNQIYKKTSCIFIFKKTCNQLPR